MKKVYRFTYGEALTALEKIHPELLPPESEWLPPHKRTRDYVEVEFEIEPMEAPKQDIQKFMLDGPITTYVEQRPTHTDDGYPM